MMLHHTPRYQECKTVRHISYTTPSKTKHSPVASISEEKIKNAVKDVSEMNKITQSRVLNEQHVIPSYHHNKHINVEHNKQLINSYSPTSKDTYHRHLCHLNDSTAKSSYTFCNRMKPKLTESTSTASVVKMSPPLIHPLRSTKHTGNRKQYSDFLKLNCCPPLSNRSMRIKLPKTPSVDIGTLHQKPVSSSLQFNHLQKKKLAYKQDNDSRQLIMDSRIQSTELYTSSQNKTGSCHPDNKTCYHASTHSCSIETTKHHNHKECPNHHTGVIDTESNLILQYPATKRILRLMDKQLKELMILCPQYFSFSPTCSVFNEWKVVSLLGSGTFAYVYEVRHMITGEIAAAKLLAPQRFSEPTQERIIDMFSKEIRYLVKCQCPGVVGVKQIIRGIEGWLVLQELITGGTLWEDYKSTNDIEQFILFIQLLQTVLWLQDHDIVHRDLKPTNILRSKQGNQLWVTDFGWSEMIYHLNTHKSELPGTIEINPPEVLLHLPHQTNKIDNYALAMNMMLLLSHQFVCRNKDLSTAEAAKHILQGISTIQSGTPLPGFTPDSWAIFLGLSDFNPNRRLSLHDVLQSSWCIRMLSRVLADHSTSDIDTKCHGSISTSYIKRRIDYIWHPAVKTIARRLQHYFTYPLRLPQSCHIQAHHHIEQELEQNDVLQLTSKNLLSTISSTRSSLYKQQTGDKHKKQYIQTHKQQDTDSFITCMESCSIHLTEESSIMLSNQDKTCYPTEKIMPHHLIHSSISTKSFSSSHKMSSNILQDQDILSTHHDINTHNLFDTTSLPKFNSQDPLLYERSFNQSMNQDPITHTTVSSCSSFKELLKDKKTNVGLLYDSLTHRRLPCLSTTVSTTDSVSSAISNSFKKDCLCLTAISTQNDVTDDTIQTINVTKQMTHPVITDRLHQSTTSLQLNKQDINKKKSFQDGLLSQHNTVSQPLYRQGLQHTFQHQSTITHDIIQTTPYNSNTVCNTPRVINHEQSSFNDLLLPEKKNLIMSYQEYSNHMQVSSLKKKKKDMIGGSQQDPLTCSPSTHLCHPLQSIGSVLHQTIVDSTPILDHRASSISFVPRLTRLLSQCWKQPHQFIAPLTQRTQKQLSPNIQCTTTTTTSHYSSSMSSNHS